jgi:hypothetical protein
MLGSRGADFQGTKNSKKVDSIPSKDDKEGNILMQIKNRDLPVTVIISHMEYSIASYIITISQKNINSISLSNIHPNLEF